MAGLQSPIWQAEVPLPRSIANTRQEILEKKWEEAWSWANERVNEKKHKMPKSQQQNGLVARRSKMLAGRFHQLRTGHCPTGQCLEWTKNSHTAECGWC